MNVLMLVGLVLMGIGAVVLVFVLMAKLVVRLAKRMEDDK